MFLETIKKNYKDGCDIFSDKYWKSLSTGTRLLRNEISEMKKTKTKEEIIEILNKNL